MYFAKILSEIEYAPNSWKGLKIGVFRVENKKEEQIGEYERNYSTFYDTFFSFQQNGEYYALYSPDYTATRIMELPSCKDIGGEERSGYGFCPADYFVPTYIEQEISWETTNANGKIDEKIVQKRVNNPEEEDLIETTESREFIHQTEKDLRTIKTTARPLSTLSFYPFGFVAGCIWGDDNSWKIQYLDLSEAEKGIIKREEKFGYIELLENQRLKDAIQMYNYKFDDKDFSNNIRINIVQTFNLKTGKVIHPFD